MARLSVLAGLLFATPAVALPPTPAEPPRHGEERHATAESAEDAETPAAARKQDDDAPATTDPPPYSETVVVTATRDEEAIVDSVALVPALDAADLAESPGALVDEILARVPGSASSAATPASSPTPPPPASPSAASAPAAPAAARSSGTASR